MASCDYKFNAGSVHCSERIWKSVNTLQRFIT